MHDIISCKTTCKVHACLAVSCYLHFWQNDQDLLHATAVTWEWNRYWKESAQKVDPGEENSPTAPAVIWTRDLSITNPVLKPLSSNPAVFCFMQGQAVMVVRWMAPALRRHNNSLYSTRWHGTQIVDFQRKCEYPANISSADCLLEIKENCCVYDK